MATPRAATSDRNATVAAGFLGWMLDAFDFFLVVMTLTAIAKEFGKSDAAIALSITLTLAFRPVGAARAVRARGRPGIGRVARDPARDLVASGPGDRAELEALPVSRGLDGHDEHGLPWDAGHVSHLSAAGLGLRTHDARRRHR